LHLGPEPVGQHFWVLPPHWVHAVVTMQVGLARAESQQSPALHVPPVGPVQHGCVGPPQHEPKPHTAPLVHMLPAATQLPVESQHACVGPVPLHLLPGQQGLGSVPHSWQLPPAHTVPFPPEHAVPSA
jgi:hypothetical protein